MAVSESKKPRVLTHGQYEELVGYEDGRPRWRSGPPSKSLTRGGYLAMVPNSGHDRASSMFIIADAGLLALRRYRDKYVLQASVTEGRA